MNHEISPNGLYREYEERAARAVRRAEHMRVSPPSAWPRRAILISLRAWLAASHTRLVRNLQPSEAGYIA